MEQEYKKLIIKVLLIGSMVAMAVSIVVCEINSKSIGEVCFEQSKEVCSSM